MVREKGIALVVVLGRVFLRVTRIIARERKEKLQGIERVEDAALTRRRPLSTV